ncbi:MAG: non-heme iron oxygenase ferredoxin subunit [Actinomycetota bacterium]|nr:non-heme iron oxygenase ferredoxin subunit [Actinomycetota bacterium]
MEIKIAPLVELPDGSGVRVETHGEKIALFRVGDTVHAIGDRCSHAEASLAEGEVFDGEVECPRHGSPFDLTTGEPGALPATTAVPVYPTAVRDGIVYLTIEGES